MPDEKYLLSGEMFCSRCGHMAVLHVEDGCHFKVGHRLCPCKHIHPEAASFGPDATARKRHEEFCRG